jgi:hypothetical protein
MTQLPGLAKLPSDAALRTSGPQTTVIVFADAMWRIAVDLADWDDDLVIDRYDGWHAGRQPMFGSAP